MLYVPQSMRWEKRSRKSFKFLYRKMADNTILYKYMEKMTKFSPISKVKVENWERLDFRWENLERFLKFNNGHY